MRQPDYDLDAAITNNPQTYSLEAIYDVLAEVPGANDELDWYWVVEFSEEPGIGESFGLIQGACDYTGWDCQSSCSTELAPTALGAANLAPEKERSSNRRVRQTLLDQLAGRKPYGVYDRMPGED